MSLDEEIRTKKLLEFSTTFHKDSFNKHGIEHHTRIYNSQITVGKAWTIRQFHVHNLSF